MKSFKLAKISLFVELKAIRPGIYTDVPLIIVIEENVGSTKLIVTKK
ncbi:unnamed protein product [marine sediment metagenome]|uniref:Uncharacterized protein n=1 Tax=marine sediment metagenome TaxID=412755 RepID=X1RU01_9ZZZZ